MADVVMWCSEIIGINLGLYHLSKIHSKCAILSFLMLPSFLSDVCERLFQCSGVGLSCI